MSHKSTKIADTLATEDCYQLLSSLKLDKISSIFDEELKIAINKKPSYAHFLSHLLRAQLYFVQEKSRANRIKNAKMPENWSIESFPFEQQPTVNKIQIEQLAELDFVKKAENIVFIGEAGVGKTGLAIGLLAKALDNGYRGLFIRAQDLFDDMYASLADLSSRKLLNRLARIDLLLIDEMGYLNLKPEQTNIFFKLMEERYNRKSTIITTNLNYPTWGQFLGKGAMVNALLDRLRHRCHTIRIEGESLRIPRYDDNE